MNHSDKHLHVVSFDIPYPANYGGVIDVFYKVKTLHDLGIKVHLHCFEYDRKLPALLSQYCYTLKAYPRKVSKHLLFSSTPYIVKSRESEQLVTNLAKDKHPILFEGLHTCFHLNDFRLSHKARFVRTHNIEHDYYQALSQVEKNIFKRFYFLNEANKLKSFEAQLKGAQGVIAITEKDQFHFEKFLDNVHHVTAFHKHFATTGKEGKGEYALYHGNLAVGENNEAALYLVTKVFNDIPYKLVIMGNHPSKELKAAVAGLKNVELIGSSDSDKIEQYIQNAHINVLPTFQSTGIKLKLLNALFSGRFCLVNDTMVSGTNLADLCVIANDPESMKDKIQSLFEFTFTIDERNKRRDILNLSFDNRKNANHLIDIIFKK